MDKQFEFKAAMGGLAEVALGQLAQQRGSAQSVKDFGARMVHDHSQANAQLSQIATKQGLILPTTPSADDQATIARLSSLSGAAFDSAYSSLMVSDHVNDIAEFQNESNTGKDPQVKAFAANTLPTLQTHLDMARALPQ